MRRYILLLIFVLSFCFASGAQARKLALLVGVDDYENIQSLRCCVNDMNALKEALIKIGFEEDDIHTLVTGGADEDLPTKKNIERRIISIVSNAQPSDMIFFAFSGHGAQEGKNVFFCSQDVKPENIMGTTVSLNKVMGVLAKCKAQSKWIVVDVCRYYSIRAGRGLKELPAPPAGIALFQSCAKGEKSQEDGSNGNSYFIKNLIAALSSNADANHDDKLTVKEVCKWTAEHTKTEVQETEKAFQHPSFSGSVSDFVLIEGQLPEPFVQKSQKSVTVPGDYATIEEAYSKVEDGTTIIIKPGKYKFSKSIYVNRPVTFQGASKRAEDVVIDCPSEDAFCVVGGSPTFQYLTVSSGGVSFAGITVAEGSPKIFRCVLTSRLGSAMYVKGANSNPHVDSCILKDCDDGSGIYVFNHGRGTYIDCEIYGNSDAGIKVLDFGNPTVIRCKIHDGKTGGVFVYDKGLGVFKDCDIYRNEYAGIEVRESGNPTVTGCKIHDGTTSGVYVWNSGLGVFNNCDIYRNTNSGIAVEDSGNPTVTGCKIHDGKSSGVYVSEKGQGTFKNCESYRNFDAGIVVCDFGNPTVIGCKIYEGRGSGVYIDKNGMGTFNNNMLIKNFMNGRPCNWYISPDAGKVKGVGNKPPIGRG